MKTLRETGLAEYTPYEGVRLTESGQTLALRVLALDGLGLMGSGGHTVEETADLDTLVTQTQRAAIAIYRLARGHAAHATHAAHQAP